MIAVRAGEPAERKWRGHVATRVAPLASMDDTAAAAAAGLRAVPILEAGYKWWFRGVAGPIPAMLRRVALIRWVRVSGGDALAGCRWGWGPISWDEARWNIWNTGHGCRLVTSVCQLGCHYSGASTGMGRGSVVGCIVGIVAFGKANGIADAWSSGFSLTWGNIKVWRFGRGRGWRCW